MVVHSPWWRRPISITATAVLLVLLISAVAISLLAEAARHDEAVARYAAAGESGTRAAMAGKFGLDVTATQAPLAAVQAVGSHADVLPGLDEPPAKNASAEVWEKAAVQVRGRADALAKYVAYLEGAETDAKDALTALGVAWQKAGGNAPTVTAGVVDGFPDPTRQAALDRAAAVASTDAEMSTETTAVWSAWSAAVDAARAAKAAADAAAAEAARLEAKAAAAAAQQQQQANESSGVSVGSGGGAGSSNDVGSGGGGGSDPYNGGGMSGGLGNHQDCGGCLSDKNVWR